jgi:hypothetical protein
MEGGRSPTVVSRSPAARFPQGSLAKGVTSSVGRSGRAQHPILRHWKDQRLSEHHVRGCADL